MYIGSFKQTNVAHVWYKFDVYPLKLWTGTTNNSLEAVIDPNTGAQRVVYVTNLFHTIGYKYETVRYCAVTKIGENWYMVGSDC